MRVEIHERVNGDESRTLIAVDVFTGDAYMQRCPCVEDIPSSGWYRWPAPNLSKFGYLGIGEFALSLHPDSP